jgi:hypothetical protein
MRTRYRRKAGRLFVNGDTKLVFAAVVRAVCSRWPLHLDRKRQEAGRIGTKKRRRRSEFHFNILACWPQFK